MRQNLDFLLRRTGAVARAVVIVGGGIAMLAHAETKKVNYIGPFDWFDTGIWSTGTVPVDGESIDLEIENIQATWDIDNGGVGVQLPASTIDIGRGVYLDSSAGGDPSLADDALVADIIRFNGSGGAAATMEVPVTANQFTSNRHGAIFNREITVTEILAQSGHQDKWVINVSPTSPITRVLMDENRGADGGSIDGQMTWNADASITTLDHVWSRLVVGTGATLTVGTYNYTYYTNQASNNNDNPVVLNGDMTVTTFNSIDIVTGTPVQEDGGTYGAIGSGATNEVAWITGTGILTVTSGPGGDYATWAAMFPAADLSDPDADHDGDGVSNDDERLFGLDPTDSTSLNAIAVPFDAGAGTLSYTRRDDALTGETYSVETSTDLVVWTRDAGAAQTPGAPDLNDVETVAVILSGTLLDEDTLFVRVSAGPLPPLFSEDFESGDGGFTTENKSTGSDWEWGTPASSDQGGGSVTEGNGGSANAWGTNLTGGYAANTNACLRSDVIDLTGVSGAELSFALSLDAFAGHTYQVDIIEAATAMVIANVIPATQDGNGSSVWETVGPTAIPGDAIGMSVRIQWTFAGNGDDSYNGAYIDDVTVTETN